MCDYTVKRIDEMEAALGGVFKRARAELGVEAFGLQVIDLTPGDRRHPAHDHFEDGQEEVYLALEGSGEIEIAGHRHPLDRSTLVRVGPTMTRKLWPGPEGLRVLVVGGGRARPYEAPGLSELGAPDPPDR